MYYKEMFQGGAVDAEDMEVEDLEKIYIICQDGEINLFEFLYSFNGNFLLRTFVHFIS